MNASKNVQQGIKDVQKVMKNDLKKEKPPQRSQQTTQTNAMTMAENPKLDEKEISIQPTEIVPKLLHSTAFEPARIHSSRENKYSEVKISNGPFLMRKNIQAKTLEFEDNETVLAKITSSQRAICASLETLM